MTALNSATLGDELTDEARKSVQLLQRDELGMGSHVKQLLGMRRKRVAEGWKQTDGKQPDEDMGDILARDIIMHPQATVKPASRWPTALALACGLGLPATAAIIMAPKIITALHPPAKPPAVVQPATPADWKLGIEVE